MAYLDQPKTPDLEQPPQAPSPPRPVTPEDIDALVGEQATSLLPDLAHQVAQPVDEAGLARATAAARTRKGVISENKASGEFGAGVDKAVNQVGPALAETFRQTKDMPKQVVGGARDAIQGLTDGFYDLGKWVEQNRFLIAPSTLASPFNAGRPMPEEGPQLPTIGAAKTATGRVTRDVTHFLTGFAATGPVVKGMGVAGATVQAITRGALSDFAFYDGHEERLANLIESIPVLKNPVTEFMAAKPEDSEVEGRLKRAVEGLGLGGLAEGLMRGFKYMRDMKVAKESGAAPDLNEQLAREMKKPPEAGSLSLLGDENAPAVMVQNKGPRVRPDPPKNEFSRTSTSDIAGRLGEPGKFENFVFSALKPEQVDALRSNPNKLELLRDNLQRAADRNIHIQALPDDMRVAIWDGKEFKPGGIGAAEGAVRRDQNIIIDTVNALMFDVNGNRLIPVGQFNSMFSRIWRGIKPIDAGVPDQVIAQSLTPKGLTPLAESEKLGKSLHLNFATIEGPEDVKRVIADVQRAFKDDIDALRGGVRKDEQLYKNADATDAFKALMDRREGRTLTDAETIAVRRVWETSATKLVEVADIASKAPTTENLYQFQRMLETHRFVQQEVAASKAEAGRSLRAWGIPMGAGGPEKLMAMDNLLTMHGGPEAAQMLASRVAKLKDLPGGASVLDDVADKAPFAKTMAQIKEVWINALLSNPKTHIVNIMGNTVGMLQNLVERSVAARWSQTVGSGDVQIGEAAAAAFASKQAMQEGLRLFWQALKTGDSQFAIQTSKAGDAGFARVTGSKTYNLDPGDWSGAAVDALGTMVNMPVRFLGAEDDFFKAVAYRQEVAMRSFRQASQEVQAGTIAKDAMDGRVAELMANPPRDIHIDALDQALYQTYTSKPGELVGAINRLERQWSNSYDESGASYGKQAAALAMRFEIPFRNTPANLLKYAFERTPLAPLQQRYRDAIARGGADADIARTRMALGSFVLLGLVDLALDGKLTAAGPSFRDSGEKGTLATLQRSGWQPYSIKAGDKYISYRRTDPIGLSIGLAASIGEILNNASLDDEKKEDAFKLIHAATFSFAEQVLDRSYISSIGGLIDALHQTDPARHVEKIIGGFVPGVVGEVRRNVDPYQRYVSNLAGELKNKIPGLSDTLPMARDEWGRPRSYQSGMGQIYDALSPIAVKTFNPEPIDKEALKEDFNLMMPTRLISASGQKFKLDDKQFSRLLDIRGNLKPSEIGLDKFDVKRVTERGEPRTGAEFVRKYGDKPLLQIVNEIVTGNHAASKAYSEKTGGRNGGKDKYITSAIVGRFQRAAAAKLFEESPDLKQRIVKGKAIIPGDIEFEQGD